MITPVEVGKLFKDARELKDMSIYDANLKSKINSSVIRDIEAGNYKRIGVIYIKSFVKKYSDFLGLDTKDILQKFEEAAKPFVEDGTPAPVHVPGAGAEIKSKGARFDEVKNDLKSQKTDQSKQFSGERPALLGSSALNSIAILLGVVTLVILFIAGIKITFGNISKTRQAMYVKTVEAESTSAATQENSKLSKILSKRKNSKPVAETSSAPGSFTLGLRAKGGNVWVQVIENGKTVFVGILDNGEEKSINAAKSLTIWTGKGENLDFIVDGNNIGKVVNGVAKNITATKEGIKLGSKWIKRIE
ncbi:MAG: DUF4115 domain-containing protein [Candidatus Omnitrophica bacterium]|nr:DUF4115 domain-containing protein [Candidatus Omnitrophota bacterium]